MILAGLIAVLSDMVEDDKCRVSLQNATRFVRN